MTSGTRGSYVPRGPEAPQMTHDFSNIAVIDYRPGLSFSSMLANKQPEFITTDSEYKVNLDNNGHTVNMQIQPAKITASVPNVLAANTPVFLSTEQIADVASRIASELCGKPVVKTEAAPAELEIMSPHVARQIEVMKDRIDALQRELKFEAAAPIETSRAEAQLLANAAQQPAALQPPAALAAPAHSLQQSINTDNNAHLDAGLRHHAEILRETQRKIDAIESDMSYVLGLSSEHGQCLEIMDEGLRNQKAEIESSHGITRIHNEQLSEHNDRLLSYESEVAEHLADSLRMEENCMSDVAALRDEYNTQATTSGALYEQMRSIDAGLQNHRNEIRALRSEYTTGTKTMDAGLETQRNEIRALRSEYTTGASTRTVDQEALNATQQAIASTQRQLSAMDSGLINHQSQIRTLKQDLDSYSAATNSNMEEHKGQLRSMRTGMDTSNTTLSAGLQHHKNELRDMRSQQNQTAQSVQNMHSMQSMQSMQSTAAPARSQLQSMQEKLDALQNTIMINQGPSQARASTNISRGDLNAFLSTRAPR